MKKIIYTKEAPEPIGPYSQAVACGPFLFCSGQIALNPENNQVVEGGLKPQAEQVMKNISSVLKAHQMDFQDIAKTTIFLTQMSDFAVVNEIYGKYFKQNPPARSTVAVSGLPKGVLVEIEVVAFKG